MKIELKNTPEQIELVKAMASRDKTVAYEAQAALAKFIQPVLAKVIQQAPVLSNLFTELPFNADDNPSIPMDLYYDVTDKDIVDIWSQKTAGGLATNEVVPTVSELKMATYSLDTAVSFDRKYAAKHRMDVIGKTFTRAAQEILIFQNKISADIIMNSLANASTNGKNHVQFSNAPDKFVLADLNELLTLSKRIWTSWFGGTPEGGISRRGVTDLLVSPEIVEQVRAMTYNPINTNTGPAGGTAADGIVAPDELRMSVFNTAGLPEFYGISLMEFNELGVDQRFNTVFDTAAGSTSYTLAGGGAATGVGHANATFDGDAEEILVGVDRSVDSLLRAIAVDEDDGTFVWAVDDQFTIRGGKIGWFGGLEEGRLCLDNRALVGKIV
jgi:hypothetical protein